jgi:hypothetical protein
MSMSENRRKLLLGLSSLGVLSSINSLVSISFSAFQSIHERTFDTTKLILSSRALARLHTKKMLWNFSTLVSSQLKKGDRVTIFNSNSAIPYCTATIENDSREFTRKSIPTELCHHLCKSTDQIFLSIKSNYPQIGLDEPLMYYRLTDIKWLRAWKEVSNLQQAFPSELMHSQLEHLSIFSIDLNSDYRGIWMPEEKFYNDVFFDLDYVFLEKLKEKIVAFKDQLNSHDLIQICVTDVADRGAFHLASLLKSQGFQIHVKHILNIKNGIKLS